ncbi:MAG TPA: DedA family protein [Candidatus Nitrosotalea sp.]|nr:DedA family protein [Candidatus Nitrosotalea sp.]
MSTTALPAILAICVLLFAEEAGVPIPLAQGEVVLIGSGLLVTSGRVQLAPMLLLTALAVVVGALCGYGWARLIGRERLRGVAARLHAEGSFDQVAARLTGSEVGLVSITRLVPGLRVYTSLVAGASGMRLRRFATALLLAVIPWVLFYTLLGVFVGVPAEHIIGLLEGTVLRLGVVLLILIGLYLGVRRLPATRPPGPLHRSSAARVLAALMVDLGVTSLVLVVFAVLLGLEQNTASAASATAVVGATALAYLVVARRSTGSTLGESMFRVRYP